MLTVAHRSPGFFLLMENSTLTECRSDAFFAATVSATPRQDAIPLTAHI